MRLVNWFFLPLACTILAAEAFKPDEKVEYSVETYFMPQDCPNQILLGEKVRPGLPDVANRRKTR